MEKKQRRWQLALILSVIALTIYNIFPTLLYYAKPLKTPISAEQAEEALRHISARTDQLESEAIEWLGSYCQLLGIKPIQIQSTPDAPHLIALSFSKSEEAAKLRTFLPRAGSLISHIPAQLTLAAPTENPKEVLIQRRIALRFSDHAPQDFFSFVPKTQDGHLSPLYREVIQDRIAFIASSLSTPHPKQHPLAPATSILEIAQLHASRPELA